jgi:predicted Zn-dependent peptidase
MRRALSLLILSIIAALVCGCATNSTVDPRTLTYPPLVFKVPTSERVVMKNGMVVYLQEDHELPLVSVTAYIRTGSIYEPAEKTGLAGLTGAVMRSGGTQKLSPDKLNAELEFMASSIESSIGGDLGNLSLASLSKNLDKTLELFGQVLMTPAFREDRVELAKNRTIEGIRRQNEDPKAIADRELQKALFPGHPLGRYPTVQTVRAINRDDMVSFHKKFYRPANIMLAVAGDFGKEDILAKLDKLFSGWDGAPVRLPEVSTPIGNINPETLLVKKAVPQSAIRMGHLGIEKNNPDLYAVRVMDYILGGGFTSRLMSEVRSNQGLAYHVGSHFEIGRTFVGTFIADTETKSESTAKAITLIRNIITGLTKAAVTDQELQLAKESIVNSFIFGFAKPEAVVNQQVRLEYYGYPKGYLENYRDNIGKVTKEDILRVAKKYLHPDAMILMVVGDDKKFDQPLSTFGTVREIKLEENR